MALKTFNLDAEVYEIFSKHCKENGISMSRKIENFIKEEIAKINADMKKIVKIDLKGERPIRIDGEHSFKKYC